jgi:tRNA(fMet)-specific endonuclease VapC
VSYLLDTNVCIVLLEDVAGPTRLKYEEASLEGEVLLLPSVVLFELRYGVERSAYPSANRQRLARFLQEGIEVLPFTDSDASSAAAIRSTLEKRKQPIGPYDTLIAGQAMARGLTLVTANVREFARVDGLRWEDWSA